MSSALAQFVSGAPPEVAASIAATPEMLMQTQMPGIKSGSSATDREIKEWEERQPKRLHVAPLGPDITHDDLQQVFKCCGEIKDIAVMPHADGEHKYGFVEFKTMDAAAMALKMSGIPIGTEREVKIKPSNPRPMPQGVSPDQTHKFADKSPEEVRNEWQYTHTLFEQKSQYQVWLEKQENAKRRKVEKKLKKERDAQKKKDKKKKKKKKKDRKRSSSSDSSSSPAARKRKRESSAVSSLPSPPRPAIAAEQ